MANIHVDGSGWNGRVSGYAIAFEEQGRFPIVVKNNENKTNNEREYEAIIEALKQAAQEGDVILSDSQLAINQIYGNWKVKEMNLFPLCEGDVILSDSQLAINQIYGNWKVKEMNLFPLCEEARKLLTEKKCTLKYIERNHNKAGKLL
jgi:ribonuclease HI